MMTDNNCLNKYISKHIDDLVKIAWEKTKEKISKSKTDPSIHLNKEASFQHLYALILENEIHRKHSKDPELEKFLATYKVSLALEETIVFWENWEEKKKTDSNEIDLLIEVRPQDAKDVLFQAAIEFKCYRKVTPWGTTRGAEDVFRKDVYADLFILEKYQDRDVKSTICDKPSKILSTYFMCLTDFKRIVEKPEGNKANTWWREKLKTHHGWRLPQDTSHYLIDKNKGEELCIKEKYEFKWWPQPEPDKKNEQDQEREFYLLLIDMPYSYE